MAIDPTNALSSAQGVLPGSDDPKNSQLDREAFMKLLVAELRHQDPLDPMESREMVTQLSQLTSVERLTAIDERLQNLSVATAGMANTGAAGLLGQTVTADAKRLPLDELGPAQAGYTLSAPASELTATIRDDSGNVVRTIALGAEPAGIGSFEWDGNDDAGNRAPAGSYRVDYGARDEAGQPVAVSTEVSGVVSSISYEQGFPLLTVGSSRVMLGDITSISR